MLFFLIIHPATWGYLVWSISSSLQRCSSFELMSILAHFLKILKPVIGPPISTGAACKFHMVHAGNTVPQLTRFSLHAPKHVEVEFEDGCSFRLSAEFLRVNSPAVDGKTRSIGGEKVIFGRRHVGIMKVEPIGNYGVRIMFDDLHKTGIYTWDYLHRLGSDKFSLMRSYIRTLKKHGLSRDPIKRK